MSLAKGDDLLIRSTVPRMDRQNDSKRRRRRSNRHRNRAPYSAVKTPKPRTSGASAHQQHSAVKHGSNPAKDAAVTSRIRVRASGSLVAVATYRGFWPSLLMASHRCEEQRSQAVTVRPHSGLDPTSSATVSVSNSGGAPRCSGVEVAAVDSKSSAKVSVSVSSPADGGGGVKLSALDSKSSATVSVSVSSSGGAPRCSGVEVAAVDSTSSATVSVSVSTPADRGSGVKLSALDPNSSATVSFSHERRTDGQGLPAPMVAV